MQVLTEGHKYELEAFENAGSTQVIQFIHKEPQPGGELQTVSDGTTNEEVLKMLIDRLEYLYGKLPSDETAEALDSLKFALVSLENRTKDRENREVEGTHKA